MYNAILDFANQYGVSYTAFAWWVDNNPNKVNTFPDLINDWSGTPLNGGVLIHNDMINHPGSSISP